MKALRTCRFCGLEAITENDLELFKKTKHNPYGRDNLCKKCQSKRLRLPEKSYLRKCRICRLEAHTEEELKLFRTDKRNRYGKQNICIPCSHPPPKPLKPFNLWHTTNWKRREYFLKIWIKPYICYYCKQIIENISKERGKDYLIIHSLDGNHNNWNVSNKVPIHAGCHTKLHHIGRKYSQEIKNKLSRMRKGIKKSPEHRRKLALAKLRDKNPNWKGDEALEETKRHRKKLADYLPL